MAAVIKKNIASVEPRSETYDALMKVSWNFDYQGSITKLDDLYQRAKENQWDAAELAWDTPIDPSNPIITAEHSQYARMPFYQRLSQSQQETFSAHSTAQVLSQFLHGEQGALLTAATVAHGVPDMKAKYYAATQTIDESRHVSFGHVYLSPTIAAMHRDDREDLAQFAFDAVKILAEGQMAPIDEGFLQVLSVSGIDPDDFTRGIQEAAEMGITRELPPGQIHSLNDLMMPALVRAGLITPRTRELFEAAGIPVNADLRVLEAMEDAKSDTNLLNAEQAAY